MKLINHAGGQARIVSDQILPATTLEVDESQVEYARLEPGDEYKRIVLRAVDVKNGEPLKLNGEYTLGLRPDDSGDVARVKITRGGNFLSYSAAPCRLHCKIKLSTCVFFSSPYIRYNLCQMRQLRTNARKFL